MRGTPARQNQNARPQKKGNVWQVHKRVARLRAKIEKSERLRLQHELDQALAEEDYNRAAKTHQELQREHRHRTKPSL